MKKEVLFVCKGNVFRSPVAEGLFKQIFGEKFVVRSAGISKRHAGKKLKDILPENILKRMKKFQVNIREHNCKAVDKNKMASADLILVMDGENKKEVVKKFPQFSNKIFLLKEFAGYKRNLDIPDAVGMPLSFHDKVYKQIKESLERMKKKGML